MPYLDPYSQFAMSSSICHPSASTPYLDPYLLCPSICLYALPIRVSYLIILLINQLI